MNQPTNRRGLQIIRTHTTKRGNAALKRHELYIKLTALEMEKSRRETERQGLVSRLQILDERLAAVIAEQHQVREAIAWEREQNRLPHNKQPVDCNRFAYSY